MPRPILVLSWLAVLIAAFSCSRAGKPSEEFQRASSLFVKVYAEKLDDAFDDPRMQMVEGLLSKVPKNSSDAAAASALAQRIATGREQARAEAKKRAALFAAANTPVVLPPPSPGAAPRPGAGAGETAVAAGPPKSPTPGMPYSQFTELFSECFRPRNSILVEGHGMREAWELKDISNCRDRYPGFDEMIVIIEENKVLTNVRKDSIKMVAVDGGPS